MDAKFLLIVMTIILLALFWGTKIYRRKEKHLGELEGKYFQAMVAAKKDQSLKEEAFAIGKAYAEALGLSQEETHAMLERDMGV